MLYCFQYNDSINSSCQTKVFGDNLSVIQSAANPTADISKKHVAISLYSVCKAITTCILELY